jgi:DNA-binding NarL/FixJ family response regulator
MQVERLPPGPRLAGLRFGPEQLADGHGGKVALTPRQLTVIQCVREGLTNGQIAARLGISHNTIKWHLKEMSRLLGAANRCALVYRAELRGLI